MTVHPSKPLASKFLALEHAILLVQSLRDVSVKLRRHDASLEKQLRRAASSVALTVLLFWGGAKGVVVAGKTVRIYSGSLQEALRKSGPVCGSYKLGAICPIARFIRRLVMSIEYSNCELGAHVATVEQRPFALSSAFLPCSPGRSTVVRHPGCAAGALELRPKFRRSTTSWRYRPARRHVMATRASRCSSASFASPSWR